MAQPNIFNQPLHIGLGGRVIEQPPFTGMAWYADYVLRNGDDGPEGRLVSAHRFTENWDSWEMHPAGEEAVICMAGNIVLHQELADGSTAMMTLQPGDYAVNPAGCWHTADIVDEATVLFITAGWGTEHRPR